MLVIHKAPVSTGFGVVIEVGTAVAERRTTNKLSSVVALFGCLSPTHHADLCLMLGTEPTVSSLSGTSPTPRNVKNTVLHH
jgi:hypothetical protein